MKRQMERGSYYLKPVGLHKPDKGRVSCASLVAHTTLTSFHTCPCRRSRHAAEGNKTGRKNENRHRDMGKTLTSSPYLSSPRRRARRTHALSWNSRRQSAALGAGYAAALRGSSYEERKRSLHNAVDCRQLKGPHLRMREEGRRRGDCLPGQRCKAFVDCAEYVSGKNWAAYTEGQTSRRNE